MKRKVGIETSEGLLVRADVSHSKLGATLTTSQLSYNYLSYKPSQLQPPLAKHSASFNPAAHQPPYRREVWVLHTIHIWSAVSDDICVGSIHCITHTTHPAINATTIKDAQMFSVSFLLPNIFKRRLLHNAFLKPKPCGVSGQYST